MAEFPNSFRDSFLVYPDEDRRQFGKNWLEKHGILLLLKCDLSALSDNFLQVWKLGSEQLEASLEKGELVFGALLPSWRQTQRGIVLQYFLSLDEEQVCLP